MSIGRALKNERLLAHGSTIQSALDHGADGIDFERKSFHSNMDIYGKK